VGIKRLSTARYEVLVVIFVLVGVLLIYYNSSKDYSDVVSRLAKLCRNMYLSSCLEKSIVSVNIADKWGGVPFYRKCLKRASDWSVVVQGAWVSPGPHAQ